MAKAKIEAKAKTVEVRATREFMSTRLNVFLEHNPGVITVEQGRSLQFGGSAEMKFADYDALKFYFEEVPNNG